MASLQLCPHAISPRTNILRGTVGSSVIGEAREAHSADRNFPWDSDRSVEERGCSHGLTTSVYRTHVATSCSYIVAVYRISHFMQ